MGSLPSGSPSCDWQLQGLMWYYPSAAHGSGTTLGHLASLCAPISSPRPAGLTSQRKQCLNSQNPVLNKGASGGAAGFSHHPQTITPPQAPCYI